MVFTPDMIPKLVKRLDMTQVDIAKDVDCTVQALSRWMNGKAGARLQRRHRENFIKLCKRYKITEEDLS